MNLEIKPLTPNQYNLVVGRVPWGPVYSTHFEALHVVKLPNPTSSKVIVISRWELLTFTFDEAKVATIAEKEQRCLEENMHASIHVVVEEKRCPYKRKYSGLGATALTLQ